MEPINGIAATIASYLGKKLAEHKSVKELFNDFTTAAIKDYIRPIFLIDDDVEKPKEALKDLADDPTEPLNIEAVESAIKKAIRREPSLETELREAYNAINSSTNTHNIVAKNVNSGTINLNSSSLQIGDNS